MVMAAVLKAPGAALELAEIDLPDPGPGQVRVRLAATGVCHSDLSLANGTLPHRWPAVLGHEGAGTVVAVGPGVDTLAEGDRVLLNWRPPCGDCPACHRGQSYLCPSGLRTAEQPYGELGDGTPVYAGLGTGAFAEETLVDVRAAIPLPDGLPTDEAALLGCAVMTGFGAVVHAAQIKPGESVAVVGVGGVGLAAIQSARLAGAAQIVAVDVSAAKEELARAQGATDFVVAGDDLARAVKGLTGGGADHVLECVGRAETIRKSWEATRSGGRTTLVGVGGKDDVVSFSALELFLFARTITVCVYGNADLREDVGVLAGHVRDGGLDLGSLITDRIGLDGIPAAFERMRAGTGARSLVVFDA